MLDIRWIRDNPEALDRALANRRQQPASSRLIALDEARRAAIQKLEEAQGRRNAASKEIGAAKAKKDEATASRLMAEVASLKDTMAALETDSKAAEKALQDAMAIIPNVPQDDVPVGEDEHGNVEYRRWGASPTLNAAKEHYELGEALGQMDFEAGAKLSGSRFVVLKKGLARMERAIGQFMLDLHTEEHGYTEVQPPLLVRDEIPYGTGNLPKSAEDMFLASSEEAIGADECESNIGPSGEVVLTFKGPRAAALASAAELAETQGKLRVRLSKKTARDKDFALPIFETRRLWLIPTAEVPLTNLVRESILSEDELPLRFTALTPCFRSEAGAAGKDTRGMLRQHQFDKVELVSITTPEKSKDEHERMLTCAEEVLKRLGLHYRVMTLCTGDMGFASQKTYDIEVWLPGQGTFREISSCSVCGDFQARRMQARYRPKEGKNVRLVHTLNGSGVAVGRALIAVMENYQNPDGSITVPDALRPYMNGIERVEA
ncbi:MAG: serine--tRNA ligase [Bauldia sp.]